MVWLPSGGVSGGVSDKLGIVKAKDIDIVVLMPPTTRNGNMKPPWEKRAAPTPGPVFNERLSPSINCFANQHDIDRLYFSHYLTCSQDRSKFVSKTLSWPSYWEIFSSKCPKPNSMPWKFPNLPEILADMIAQWNLQPYWERVEKQSKNQKVPEIENQMLEFVTRGLGQNDHFVLPDLGDMNFPEMFILSVD